MGLNHHVFFPFLTKLARQRGCGATGHHPSTQATKEEHDQRVPPSWRVHSHGETAAGRQAGGKGPPVAGPPRKGGDGWEYPSSPGGGAETGRGGS